MRFCRPLFNFARYCFVLKNQNFSSSTLNAHFRRCDAPNSRPGLGIFTSALCLKPTTMGSTSEDLLNGKTPVSFLQELCTRYGVEPVYKLESQGPVTEPNFLYSVTAGDQSATGYGANKKKAKHNAALALLRLMMPGQLIDSNDSSTDSQVSSSKPDNDVSPGGSNRGNSVGRLQEMSQKQMLGMPIYEYSGGQGPSHAPNFICCVQLRNFKITGRGMSKKLAKQNAAEEMLRVLTSEGADALLGNNAVPSNDSRRRSPASNEVSSAEPQEASQFMSVEALTSTLEALKVEPNGRIAGIGGLDPLSSQKISMFYKDLKVSKLPDGGTIAKLQAEALNGPRVPYEKLLSGIAEEHSFEATYVDLNELSSTGQNQCMLQLSSLPVAVVYGSGPSRESARALAAHNALQYLKIMTERKKS